MFYDIAIGESISNGYAHNNDLLTLDCMFIIYWILMLYARTWRIHFAPSVVSALEKGLPIAFWHGTLGILACRLPSKNCVAIVSPSKDGSRLAQFLSRRGFEMVRGSSHTQGTEAQRRAVIKAQQGKAILYAVDGSRGPQGIPKKGAFALAIKLDKPVCVLLIRCDRYWTIASWDSFVIPKLGAKIDVSGIEFDVENIEEGQAMMMTHLHPYRFPLVD